MLRPHFEAEDLLRVSTADEPSPLLQAALAFVMLRRGDPRAGVRRRQQHRHRLPLHVRPLDQLLSPGGAGPHFLHPPGLGVDDGLEADFPPRGRRHAGGRGLVLQPSLFWTGPPLVACHADRPGVLIYPALTPLPLPDGSTGRDPLAVLLGATRAAVLRLLTRQHSTTGLARELQVSAASVSTHTKALREAGLITSHRDGKAVQHWCTPLGLGLMAHSAPS